jgi:hypothetical protein
MALAASVLEISVPLFLAAVFAGAVLGGLVALFLKDWIRLPGGAAGSSPQAARFLREVESAQEGLREFAREVEERLDAKLDRLEVLVRPAGTLSGTSDTTPELEGPSSDSPPILPGAPGAAPRRGEGLDSFRPEDKDVVLSMAARGAGPEAIAEAAGLLRGEVDLILRLHRSELVGREKPA